MSNLARQLTFHFKEAMLPIVSLVVPKLSTKTMITVRVWVIVLMVVPVPMMLGHVLKPMTLMTLLFLFFNMLVVIIK